MVEVRVEEPAAPPVAPLEIALRDGVVVRVAHGAEPTWAGTLLKALLA
jgi:hypothetical protein